MASPTGRKPHFAANLMVLLHCDWRISMALNSDGFERIVHRIDGVETVTYAIGAGDPVVFLHGRTIENLDWARALASEFRIFCPQHPNFGESEAGQFHSVQDYSAHYEMLFPALELDSFAVVGESIGAAIAHAFATGTPDDVTCLALIAPEDLGEDAEALWLKPVLEYAQPSLMILAEDDDAVPKDLAKAWRRSKSGELVLLPAAAPISLETSEAVAAKVRSLLQA